jgi:hypothetical protein
MEVLKGTLIIVLDSHVRTSADLVGIILTSIICIVIVLRMSVIMSSRTNKEDSLVNGSQTTHFVEIPHRHEEVNRLRDIECMDHVVVWVVDVS